MSAVQLRCSVLAPAQTAAARTQTAAPARHAAFAAGHRHAALSLRTRRSQPVAAMRAAAPTQMKLHYWPGPGGMQEYLRDQARVKSMQPGEIDEIMQTNEKFVLLDVREPQEFVDVFVPGSVNVPLYLPLQSMSVQSLLKRAVYAVNGMSGTELNPNFLTQITEKIPDKSTPIGVMCMSGGTVEASSTGGMEGKKSRSLISIYRLLVELGYTDVVHVEGGMREWAGLGWPVEGEDIESWKAKAAAMP